ncbi:mitochondrial distribution and morphology protein 38 [Ophiostoma piceae UAMH 11346]|uniref:Mitochondrial distribution and morphology protein 38 n=1 Tax=Ophiostoma piceae (strain UAMH 11346) TaxID=1262450 RepID=S3CTQ3_OPHP1|nr:mitochondrial distribution and morphology protein 38 [Ophiostoma piceae UAMH 11346]
MSVSVNAARRATALNNPFLGRGRTMPRTAMRAASMHLLNNSRNVGARNNVAFALGVPMRNFSTETHSSTGGPPAGPPPGFDALKAKIPLPKEQASSNKAADASASKNTAAQAAAQASAKAAAASTNASSSSSSNVPATAGSGAGAAGLELEAKNAKKDEKKLTMGQKIKKEAQHYWDGTKLLATEVKISTRLAVKMAAGYELTRRENRQLQRTVQDLGRLVPFSMFVIVPFAELLLPIALRLFPNLLPSTYEGQSTREKKTSMLRATRREVSDFLRQTLKETGLPIQASTTQRVEFTNFFRKVRSTGEKPTAEDVIKVCKIFKDDVTLDNLSRPQLVSMCRYLNLNTFGTDMMLRYQIRHRMRQIKRDDRAISYEGVDSLLVGELQTACASRGIKSYGVSPARLREDLQTWLDLRLKEGVPSTLLVLSNAYMYGQTSTPSTSSSSAMSAVETQIEALTGVLSSIPEELFHEIELEVHNAEGAATNKQRLEVLKEQEDLIEDEAEQNQENQETGFATPRDVDDIDEKEERQLAAEAQKLDKAQTAEAVDAEKDQVDAVRQAPAPASASAEAVAKEAKKSE